MTTWEAIDRVPVLRSGHVHVWRIDLPAPATAEATTRLAVARRGLTPEEIARAGRFRVEHAHLQFALTRAGLRQRIGSYLERDPSSLRFVAGERGKPHLDDRSLHFNVSHSGRTALLAFSRDFELGIDVEQVWDRRHSDEIAERYFSPAELAGMEALDESDRKRAFFWVWVRKEAYIKARGDGLYLPLDSFDVTVGEHPTPQLIASRDHPDDPARWSMSNISITPEYPACLMVASKGAPIRVRTLTYTAAAI